MFFLRIALQIQTFSLVFGQNYFDRHPLYEDVDCNSLTDLIVEINFKYFDDQHTITLIDSSTNPTASAFKCLGGNKFRPLLIVSNVNLVKRRKTTDRSSVSSFSTTEGFLINSKLTELPGILRTVAAHNPRSKVMAMLFQESEVEAQKVLHEAFHVHKMLKVSVLLLNDVHENGVYLKSFLNLVMYNPFSGKGNTREKSQFINLDFTTFNQLQRVEEMKGFIEQRVKNLHGFPLRISMFDYPMVSKKVVDVNGRTSHYDYVDGDIVSTFANLMNFKCDYENNSDNYFKYGFQYPNGTFVGSLSYIEDEKADLAGNPKLIADYNTSNSVFLQPITMVRFSFIIRKRKTHKLLIISMFDQLDHPSKSIALALSVLLPLVYVLVSRNEQRIFNPLKRFESFDKSLLYSFALMNNISMKHSSYTSTRIIVGTFLFYALIFSTLFQSSILNNLNSNLEFGKVTSIHQLVEEGYKVKMPSYVALLFKERGLDKVSWMMKKTKQTYVDVAVPEPDLPNILEPGKKIAFLWTELFNTNFLNHFYDKETGENHFESVPETAHEFYISLMTPKNSPFIESFNDILMKYTETGFGAHHIGMAYADNNKILIQRLKNREVIKESNGAITLQDLRTVFQTFLITSAISLTVFIAEALISRMKITRFSRSHLR